MRAAIENEAARLGVTLVSHSPSAGTIEFSHDQGEGRLWTDTDAPAHYEALCREVKKGSAYDREASLWVKRESSAAFVARRKEKAMALAELVAKNRRYAIEVLGGRPVPGGEKG